MGTLVSVNGSVARATRRRQLLHERYDQGPLAVLAQIYEDEDWAVLHDAAGKQFATFTAFVAAELGMSSAYARRCQQLIRLLFLPIQELYGAEVAAGVRMFDMENLGVDGAARLLEELRARPLDGPNPEHLLRDRIVAAAAARREKPQEVPAARSVAAEQIAAAVPSTRAGNGDEGEDDGLPWATSPGEGAVVPPWSVDVPPVGSSDRISPDRVSALGAALDLILAVDLDAAVSEVGDRVEDLVDATSRLMAIRDRAAKNLIGRAS